MRRGTATSAAAGLLLMLCAAPAAPSAPDGPQVSAEAAAGAGSPIIGDAWVLVPGLDSDADGEQDRVHVQYHLPRRAGPLPVVLEASPYLAGGNAVRNHDVDVELHVPQGDTEQAYASPYESLLRPLGYGYVYAESIGSGSSTGCPSSGGPQETAAMVAVVRWLTGDGQAVDGQQRPVSATWSNGRVGMIGVSYNGTLANAVAATGVAGLDAIVPVSAISSWYDYYRSQGAVRSPGGYQGEDADVLARYVLTRDGARVCRPGIDRVAREQDRRTGDVNRFWRVRDYRRDASTVEAAVLSLHGLGDENVMSDQTGRWLRALDAHAVPTQAWWHQGGHGDWLVGGDRRWRHHLVSWFDRWLKDERNGVMRLPGSVVATGGGHHTSASWPAPRADTVRLRPSGAGRRVGILGARTGLGRTTLVDEPSLSVRQLAGRTRSPHRLMYRTAALERAVLLSGIASVRLRASFDRPAANVSVGLVELDGDRPTLLSEGWLDPQNSAGTLRQGRALAPGRVYDLRVDLDMVLAHRVPAGHRLALVIASSDSDFTLRPPAGTRMRVSLGATTLRLPVVGGRCALSPRRSCSRQARP
jgi:X-Pro dipeptidyl-peptidase